MKDTKSTKPQSSMLAQGAKRMAQDKEWQSLANSGFTDSLQSIKEWEGDDFVDETLKAHKQVIEGDVVSADSIRDVLE